jgi:hypothetical protein
MSHHSEATDQVKETFEHLGERIHEAGFRVRAGAVLTVFAVLLAIVAVFVQRGLKDEIVASVDLSGTRGSLETAQLLQMEAQRNAAELSALGQLPGVSEEERATLAQEAGDEAALAATEADDAAHGTGARQLTARLLLQEHHEHDQETQVERLEYGEILLEVALVLGSLAVLFAAPRILIATVVAGIAGVVVAVVALLF